ncbi:hypothetical protein [Acidipila rosea]|uniref:Uncharacterized protein n=1 Tax=Acidipila rosea TaxID=768535 RepID=A0A4V2PUR9_9BACT|nr:hypothetical protein [Acidipila rosea]MBW4045932.1 hypothetical protein [Acidobacteriota bacterium]TCK71621.1 hypothetical protein C7378_2903 [Acidipila rosea]
MRRSTIWFLLAVLWIAAVPVALVHHHKDTATIDAVVALIFFFIGVRLRGREMLNR